MKRTLAAIMAFALILAGCTTHHEDTASEPSTNESINTPATESTEIQTESQVNTNDEPTGAALPMVTVSVPVTSEDFIADDGTVIFRVVSQNMHLVMQDPDVADRIIVDFLNRIDHFASMHEEILQQAQSAYQPSDLWTPYLCSITYAPQRIDQSVLSLYGTNVQYTGGAHPVLTSHAANYNVVTGDVLTLGSIITDQSSMEKLCALTIQKLSDIAAEKYLRDGFEETIRHRFSVEESYDEDWYFTADGLCFYFDPYAIAPYAAGVITAEIPYAELVGIIDDAYFPPELEESNGEIVAESAENADMTKFTRISEVVLENEAPMYVISTDNNVHNLRIVLNDAELGSYYTVFAAQTLSSTDAVVIQANISLYHRIDIYYESNGQNIVMPLVSE